MNSLRKMPREKTLDSSCLLLMEGYRFIQKRCCKYQSDLFQTRLMGKKVICMSGKDAARIFYNDKYFKRQGVAPKRIQKTLLGKGGIQGLDGVAHRYRRQMFLSIMTPDNMKVLIHYIREQWNYNSIRWNRKEIVLYDEVQKLLCQAACRWAGVPLDYYEINQRARDLGKMVDGFAAVGPRYWQAKRARKNTEMWIRGIIKRIRSQELHCFDNSAAYIISWHRDHYGQLLNTQIAAVELINILRPIVAIATYITFGALALYEHPECRNSFWLRNPDFNQQFVQEVRRYYPFAPFVGAMVKKNFIWDKYYFKKGTLVLLDIYGTNHDSRLWKHPYEFMPERFKKSDHNPYQFIPQGGGDYNNGHRCPGDMLTTEVMKASLDFIACHLSYKVPHQNMHYRLCRIPALPKSRFVIK
ncbi:MAG: cytochrome [Anaerocolumna sp.]|jgi:fatty-acid peroxygenase|nr:cytochrome [Anaerocolumna sp.]